MNLLDETLISFIQKGLIYTKFCYGAYQKWTKKYWVSGSWKDHIMTFVCISAQSKILITWAFTDLRTLPMCSSSMRTTGAPNKFFPIIWIQGLYSLSARKKSRIKEMQKRRWKLPKIQVMDKWGLGLKIGFKHVRLQRCKDCRWIKFPRTAISQFTQAPLSDTIKKMNGLQLQ